MAQFPSVADPAMRRALPDPGHAETFARSVLDLREREDNRAVVTLHRDLLRLRKTAAAFRAQAYRGVDGAVLGPEALVLRYFDGAPGIEHDLADPERGDRLLVVNLGRDLPLDAAPEPLLAPPAGCRWDVEWSSEAPEYGGCGTPEIANDARGWHLPGHAAIVLRPAAAPARTGAPLVHGERGR
jgi:maltooligosyltrehalose trehalohydrolase